MKIEKVTVEDTAELLAIYAPYVEKTAISFEYTVPDYDTFRERIRSIGAVYPYLKAVEDGKIVGYAYAARFKERKSYDWSVETTVYVRSDFRRRGVGKALYSALERSLSRMGIRNMNACIVCPAEPNPYVTEDSIRFHSALGFREVGRFDRCGFKFDRWFDMAWMQKSIGTYDAPPSPVSFGKWEI